MSDLIVKSVYFDDSYKIADRNKEFYVYFETVGNQYSSIDDFDIQEGKEDFVRFVKTCQSPYEFRIFKFRNISKEYRYNVIFVRKTVLYEKELHELVIIDIRHAIDFFVSSRVENSLINTVFGITNEYMFIYQQKNNNFKMIQFFQNRKVVLYDQDLDSWSEIVVRGGYIPAEQKKNFEKMVSLIRSCPENFSFELKCGLRGDPSTTENLNFIGVRYSENENAYLVGRIMAGAKLQEAQKSSRIVEELKIDSLTKVYNKKTIVNFAEKRFNSGQKGNCALIIVDLDHFKPVNDAYGHLAGDMILEKTGKILRDIVGENGFAGRYGGDEFLLLVEKMDSEQILRGTLRTIMISIRNAFEDAFEDIKITASLGCSVFPVNGDNYVELFKKADFCLYRAKDKGRDRYVFFRDDLHRELYEKAIESRTGIKYDDREILELKHMSEYMQLLNQSPYQAIKNVLEHMLKTYNLDAINIYYGEDMKRVYCVGKKMPELDCADYVFGDAFKQALNGKTYVRMDFPNDMPENGLKFKELITKRGVKSTIQCVLGSADNVKGLVTFDRLKESSLWAEYEFNCTVMFAAAMTLLPESTKVDFAIYSRLKD